MNGIRFQLALDTEAIALPDTGRVAVIRPRAGDDLGPLDRAVGRARIEVVTGFRPDHDAFAAAGYTTRADLHGPYGAAVVSLPRARAHARALVAAAAAAVAPGGPVVVDGQKTDGIDSLLRDLRGQGADLSAPVAKAHGRLAAFAAGTADLSGWTARPHVTPEGFTTLPGVFSAEGPDRGSALLAAALPGRLPARLADLGAGWGYLSAAILAREGVQTLDLVEAEADALACARINIPDPRARFHWADATRFHPDRPLDAVVTNPPFHEGRAPDPGLGIAFLRAAAGMLSPSGTLWLVANRHLPYAPVLAETFRDHEEIGGDAVFRLIRAHRPIRPRG